MKRVVLLCAVYLTSCAPPQSDVMTGYGEMKVVYAAPMDAGRIEALGIREGDEVKAGQILFRLEAQRFRDAQSAATASAGAARVRSADALADAERRAQADLDLATDALRRSQSLYRQKFLSEAGLEADRAAYTRAKAALEQAKAERVAAGLDARAASAEAALQQRRVNDLSVQAPVSARVERIYRRVGEVVAAGDPVVALSAVEEVRVRFFVPQARLSQLAPGARVLISCAGCPAGLAGRVSFVASEPQFTPPVIYSVEERDKLLYLAEAIPDEPRAIRPGLPVDVRPAQ